MAKRHLTEVALLGPTGKIEFKGAGKGRGFAVTQNLPAGDVSITEVTEMGSGSPAVTVESESKQEQPSLSREDILGLIQSAIEPFQSKISATEQSLAEAKQALEAAEQEKAIATEKALEVQQKADAEKAELEKALAEKQEQLTATESAKAIAERAQKAAEELGKLVQMPSGKGEGKMQLEVLGTGSQEMRNWQQMLKNAPGMAVMHDGRQFIQRDFRASSDYLRRNLERVRGGVEAEMREAGFLQGAGATAIDNALTTAAIPSIAFSYLSEFVRMPTDRTLIYSQFARQYSVPGTAPRFQGQVPRYPYSPGPTAKADRILTPGTDLTTTRQGVAQSLVPVTIEELGLGKDNNNAPIALSSFVQAFSLENLEQIIARNLGRDYNRTKDLFIRTEYFTANTVVYNNASRIVTAPGSVVNGGVGTVSRGFLRSLSASMFTQGIPTYSNGLYVLVLTPNQLTYLLNEFAGLQQFTEPASTELEMISQVLRMNGNEDYGGVVSGYRMSTDGFMVFVQNVHSTGAAGTTGVQTETTGAGARVTETCFAFGADAICWATALPVEIRQDEVTNFRRRDSWIWYSHENCGVLDVNEVTDSGQIVRERRVMQLRLLRDPV